MVSSEIEKEGDGNTIHDGDQRRSTWLRADVLSIGRDPNGRNERAQRDCEDASEEGPEGRLLEERPIIPSPPMHRAEVVASEW